jgi:hypothetical protein
LLKQLSKRQQLKKLPLKQLKLSQQNNLIADAS